MRIALGGFVQETNSFSPIPGSWLHFGPGQILRSEELAAGLGGTRSEVAGALDAAREAGLDVAPLLMATTSASAGPMRADVFATVLGELLERLRGVGPVDGALLVLHGAMCSQEHDDATGEVLRAFRAALPPDTPLVATLDLHANVTARMVAEATALVGYHTAPHVDMYETGRRGLALLLHALRGGARPYTALRRLPMLLPAENGRTTEGPYAELMARAEEMAQMPGVLDVSPFAVQPWLDLPDVGCSVLVTTAGDAPLADALADELAAQFWQSRARFDVQLAPAAEAIRAALASDRRPHVLADSADAPSSGAPGDSTVMLRLLIEARPQRPCLLNIVDAEAAGRLADAGVGSTVTLEIGASSGRAFYEPLAVTGTVRAVGDGDFVNEGPGFNGVTMHMGKAAVLDIGQVSLVVMERPVIQWDPALYTSLGLDPRAAQIVVVKSPAAFRAAYGPFAAEIVVVDAPGVCSPNLRALPYRRVTRPIYPLDE
jgi:microcystin degradation protein MlrC